MTQFSVVNILSVLLVLVVLSTESHCGSATVHISARVLPWASLTSEELLLRHAYQIIDVRVILDTEAQTGMHALVIKPGIDAI